MECNNGKLSSLLGSNNYSQLFFAYYYCCFISLEKLDFSSVFLFSEIQMRWSEVCELRVMANIKIPIFVCLIYSDVLVAPVHNNDQII